MPILLPAIVAGVAGCSITAAAAWQRLGDRAALRRWPAPGQMLDVDGRRVHVMVARPPGLVDPPRVLLAAHSGGTGLYWANVVERLRERATVIAYDRPGLGWSEPDVRPFSLQRAVDLMHTVAKEAGGGPLVVVGWSYGGMLAQAFARSHPTSVAGIVLVESMHPDQDTRLPALRIEETMRRVMRWSARVSGFGVARMFGGRYHASAFETRDGTTSALPPSAHEAVESTYRSRRPIKTVVRELDDSMAALLATRQLALTAPLPDVPLTVISRGVLDESAHDRMWDELQADLVHLVPRGSRQIATRSGHMVPITEPDLVAGAIIELLERVARTP